MSFCRPTFDPLPMLSRGADSGCAPAAARAGAPPARGASGRGPTGLFDGVYVSATRENSSGDVILKLVNVQAAPQPLTIDLQGVTTIKKDAAGEMITGGTPLLIRSRNR